jgi:peptide subunit release factor 1 (eRF1)
VLPYLAYRGERFAYVIVAVDRKGGEITCVATGGERSTISVQGDEEYPIRKTKAGDWNQSRFQRAAEEAWKANAKKVARAIDQCVKQIGAQAIMVTGDPQARGVVLEEISDLEKVVETADPHGVLELKTAERVTAVTARFEHELAHGQRAVTGLLPTVEAVRRGQVETLLLSEHSTDRLWVGPDPQALADDLGELHRMGVADPAEDRADAALIRAAAATDADLIVLPKDPPFGAVLRYADEATLH